MSLFTETVTLRLRGEVTGTDDYGNDIIGPPRDVPSPAWFEPRESGENTSAREQVVSGLWLFLPEDAPVSAVDAVVVRGLDYEVDGEPGRFAGGFTLDGCIKVALRRVTG